MTATVNQFADANEFTKALLTLPRIGFNKLERNWYFDRFESQQKRLEAGQKLAQRISKDQNIAIADVQLMMAKSKTDPQALAMLTPYLDDVHAIEEDIRREAFVNATIDMASLILRSRLPIDWVLSNQTKLETEYAIDFSSCDLDGAKGLPRAKWINDAGRERIVTAIVEMLPGSIVSEIAEYAAYELNEGPPPKAEPETMAEGLGKHPSESPKSETPDDN